MDYYTIISNIIINNKKSYDVEITYFNLKGIFVFNLYKPCGMVLAKVDSRNEREVFLH